MRKFIAELFKDKNGCYSLRELAIALLLLALIASWIAQQFFNKAVPEFMFYSFASLIGAGCFGYSIERKSNIDNNNPTI
ncbi:hypothetical protein PDL71_10700 [Lacibacter sp. MH-610]|jgi:hypothetical protein|uniref:hypothetical protein n=1 Tax=Chitinophagaceae TaxID=563835 RepID=UPI001AC2D535|nr:hypothetical protein [Chitinophagales bacterium]